jgi:hypothetical protein
MHSIKEAAKGAAILTLGCIGMAVFLSGALWLAKPIFLWAGWLGIFVELVALLFLIPFLGILFSDRFL